MRDDQRAGVGQTRPQATFFEVACQGGPGYIVTSLVPVSVDQKAQLITCLAFDATSP